MICYNNKDTKATKASIIGYIYVYIYLHSFNALPVLDEFR